MAIISGEDLAYVLANSGRMDLGCDFRGAVLAVMARTGATWKQVTGAVRNHYADEEILAEYRRMGQAFGEAR